MEELLVDHRAQTLHGEYYHSIMHFPDNILVSSIRSIRSQSIRLGWIRIKEKIYYNIKFQYFILNNFIILLLFIHDYIIILIKLY